MPAASLTGGNDARCHAQAAGSVSFGEYVSQGKGLSAWEGSVVGLPMAHLTGTPSQLGPVAYVVFHASRHNRSPGPAPGHFWSLAFLKDWSPFCPGVDQ